LNTIRVFLHLLSGEVEKMVTATALVVPEVGAPIESQSVELDSLRPQEVLVDIKATGICHTDIAVRRGKLPVPLPAVLGHEGCYTPLRIGFFDTDSTSRSWNSARSRV
jgi:aryl-alcohol dehydrogenase